MSDDGAHADSPDYEYDDDWDDQSIFDLADDLAQHSAYSPVWQETPFGELEPYHSDWEYYSDDYYDDDPNLLAGGTLDGGTPNEREGQNQKRGKKRKLEESRTLSEANSQMKALVGTIRGTVWARQHSDATETYTTGENEKVSLLPNWRDLVFRQEDSLPHNEKRDINSDETWANNMGLADMGLHNQQARRGFLKETVNDEDRLTSDEDDVSNEEGYTASEAATGNIDELQSDAEETKNDSSPEVVLVDTKKRSKRKHSLTKTISPLSSPVRKRRKQILSSSPESRDTVALQAAKTSSDNANGLAKGSPPRTSPDPASLTKKRKVSPAQRTMESPKNRRGALSQLQQSRSPSSREQKQQNSSDAASPPRRSRRLQKENS